jgi:hypothetical protein
VHKHDDTSDVDQSQSETSRTGSGSEVGSISEDFRVLAGCAVETRESESDTAPLLFINGYKSTTRSKEPKTQGKCPFASDAENNLAEVLAERERNAGRNSYLAKALNSLGASRMALNASGCGSWLMFRLFSGSGSARLREAEFCDLRGCRDCAAIRAAQTCQIYAAKSIALMRQSYEAGRPLIPMMITFNQPTGPEFRDQWASMRSGMSKLNRHRRNSTAGRCWSELCVPDHMACSIESKRSSRNESHFHVHCHSIALSSRLLDLNLYHEAWSNMTGWAGRPDVRLLDAVRDHGLISRPELIFNDGFCQVLTRDFVEVFKYSLKLNELSFPDIAEMMVALYRKRTVFGWNGYNGLALPDELGDVTEEAGTFRDLHYVRHVNETKSRLLRSRNGSETGVEEWFYERNEEQ